MLYVKIGHIEVPPENLDQVVSTSTQVSFSGDFLQGDQIGILNQLKSLEGKTVHLYWRDRQGREGIRTVYVTKVEIEERSAPDGTKITRYSCQTQPV